jgi:hypothetical protein
MPKVYIWGTETRIEKVAGFGQQLAVILRLGVGYELMSAVSSRSHPQMSVGVMTLVTDVRGGRFSVSAYSCAKQYEGDITVATEPTTPNDESTEGATPDLVAPPVSAQNVKGFALAALIVGIFAFMVGLVPGLGIILGAGAAALGAIALVKKQPKGLAVTGLALGGVALLVSLSTTIALGAGLSSIADGADTAILEPAVPEAPVEAESEAPVEGAPVVPDVPAEYESALSKADTYSNMMHMSKAGLFDQLTSEYGEQFSAEAAQYAVDNVVADWNANALAKAKTYQDDMSMSPAAIHDQLTSEYGEQFTASEADYAIANL